MFMVYVHFEGYSEPRKPTSEIVFQNDCKQTNIAELIWKSQQTFFYQEFVFCLRKIV